MSARSTRATLVAASALLTLPLLAACSAAPSDAPASSSVGVAGTSDFLACAVSGAGGWNDNSFNQQVFDGLKQAESELGVQTIAFESQTTEDFAPGLDSLVSQGCNLIFSVGFDANEAANETAAANPDISFVSIDGFQTDDSLTNFKPVTYAMDQSSYLAGYLAAAQSKSHTIATFGAVQNDAITSFMDGYYYGAKAWSDESGTPTTVTGWDATTQTGTFVGDFANQVQAKAISQSQIDQGADILFPVAGPLFIAAGEAIRDNGDEASLIGVDSDIAVTSPDYADIVLTSVEKRMTNAVVSIIDEASKGSFDPTPYVGTLENDATGLAPFGAFDTAIPDTTKATLEELQQGIIDGTVDTKG